MYLASICSGDKMDARKKYRTDIERMIESKLIEEKISYVYDYPIRCKYGYRLDFAIQHNGKKIDVEADGERWHGGVRDKKRDGFMKSKGWVVVRFKGQEIKDDVDSCIERIKRELWLGDVG